MIQKTIMTDNIQNLPIKHEVCFANAEGVFDERVQAQQMKLLGKVAPFLKRFLEPDEEILLAATARAPMGVGELFFASRFSYFMKHTVLVFTNRRVLQFLTRMNYVPKGSVSQIRYGDVEKYDTGSVLKLSLNLKYRNGRQERFTNIGWNTLKKIDAFMPVCVQNAPPTEFKQRHSLCPRCRAPLPKGKYVCPNCRLVFKNPGEAVRNALLFPGGGFFYTRHRLFGIQFAFSEGVLIVLAIIGISEAFKHATEWPGIIGIAAVLMVIKFLHIYQARRYVEEYIPIEKNFTPTNLG